MVVGGDAFVLGGGPVVALAFVFAVVEGMYSSIIQSEDKVLAEHVFYISHGIVALDVVFFGYQRDFLLTEDVLGGGGRAG